MAINVTQKDATLREIIDWCDAHHITRVSEHDMFARGYNQAIDNVATHCRNNLGYTGHMPLEVPNQSEQAKGVHRMATISHSDGWGNPLCPSRYECSCGYWTYDKDEAEMHFKENS